MNPLVLGRFLFFHENSPAPHLLEAAEIAGRELLAPAKSHSLALSRHDHRHVVQRRFSHGIPKRHGIEGRAIKESLRLSARGKVRGLPRACPADRPIVYRIRFSAQVTAANAAPAALAKELRLDDDGFNSVEFRPRLPDLLQKELAILLLLRLELKQPCRHFRPGPNFLSIDKDTDTFSAVLVKKAQCKPPQVDNFQPAVSDRARREQLYGVGEAVSRFGNRLKQHPTLHAAEGKVHHDPTRHQTGRGVSVKRLHHTQVFFERILSYIHLNIP